MKDKLGNIDILRASCNIQTVQDGRGAIFTWLPDEPIVEFNMLCFQPNKIRGNHCHPEFTEYFLIVDGTVVMVTKDPTTGKEINMLASKGVCFRTPPNTPHAVHAVTQAVCISCLTKAWDKCNLPIIYKDLVPFNSDYVEYMESINENYNPANNTGKKCNMDKKTVAVIGAAGFVGSQIAKAVVADDRYTLIPVVRNDPVEELISKADIIIHSANPAGRMRAENDPVNDFKETVEKTAKLFDLSKGKRFIQISSLSCRTQLYGNYGRNRRACELLVSSDSTLIVRLGPMFGGNRKKDMLHDILSGRKIYVDAETRYAYVDVAWAGRKVVELLEGLTGIQEIGARNDVRLGDIHKHFGSTSVFSGINETQIPESCSDGPDANDVYNFAKEEKIQMEMNL